MTQTCNRMFRFGLAGLALAGIIACAPASGPKQVPPNVSLSSVSLPGQVAPVGAPSDSCWDKIETPAVIETVTHSVLIEPADITPDGLIRTPARYRKEETQRVAVPRQTNWIEILCPDALTPGLLASLQRALAARGLYSGAITSEINADTRNAILGYQSRNGAPLSALTVQTALDLGLVAKPRDP